MVFDIPIAGSVPLLVLLSVPFIVAALSLGLLISTLAQTQGHARQFTMLTLLPSILPSGYISPRETFPGALYYLSNIFPVTYYIQILRGIIVRGVGLGDLMRSLAGPCALNVLLLSQATARFRKSIA